MTGVLIVVVLSLFICCAISYIMGLLWFSDIRNRRLRSFFFLGIEIFLWTLLNAVAMVVHDNYFPFIYTLRMVMVCIIPFGVAWFILDFVGSPLKNKMLVRFFLIFLPLIDILAMVSNPLHHMYFSDYSIPMPGRMPLFWMHLGMDSLLIIVVFTMLIRFIIKGSKDNPLLVLTGLGLFIPYTINIAYTFGMIPFDHDLTPIGFFFTFMLFVFVAHRSRLFSVTTTLFSTTMNAIEDIIIISNEKNIIVDVNQRAHEVFGGFEMILGRTKTEEFFNFLGHAAEVKPDNLVSVILGKDDAVGECSISLPNGEKQTYTLNWRSVYDDKNRTGYILMMADVTRYRMMISEINKKNDELQELTIKAEAASQAKSDLLAIIEQRDNLLRSVNIAAVYLLNADNNNFADSLFKSMKVMADVVDVDRVYIWKNHSAPEGLRCTQLYEWSEGAEPQQGLEITADISYDENVPDWERTLSADKCINNIVSRMSRREQEQLSPQGIKSILVVPIFINSNFWGFVGFDDCRKERLFTKEEEVILRSGSLLFAHAYHRNEMNQNVRDTSARLEIALVQANNASKAKGDFLSNMSHEMRTPMNAIIGMTTIGKKSDDIDGKNHALNRIGDAASHLLGVINDVLDMAKIEADKLELFPVEFCFDRMLQKVMTVVYFRADEKKQELTVNLDPKIPRFIIGDDQRITQVITNLISNAVKFTPEGGAIRLDSSLAGEADGLYTIRVEVEDNGIGISPEQQGNIFRAFEQAESGTSREYGGTGLGLVICKRIVEMMGGEIWVESELGKGSKFIFTFTSSRGSKVAQSMLRPEINWKNVRILAVDDSAETLAQFTDLFASLGIRCDTAKNGSEACGVIDENGPYDIYFIDWRMPVMDGIELTKWIKAKNDPKHSVVIMITAADWEQIKHEAAAAGVEKHLLKPLFSSTIVDCINEFLGVTETGAEKTSGVNEFTGRSLLLAEDVAINREILISLLEDTGIEIDCAENGAEAVEMIKAAPGKYDLVFMDMQMPKMDGLEATRRIRAMPLLARGALPIVAMTANVFKDDIEACIEAGMDDHIGKPLEIDNVTQILRKYLK
ncbi:MAG: response regulator [Defluviitaleaceae bacterium]|nr:response regulator [Defluviitaleaceae bacterium]